MDVRGHLDLLLLGTLFRRGPSHGYALIVGIRQDSDGAFDLPDGSIYPALQRLERDGLVTSRWDVSTARPRRVYELTRDGASALVAKRAQWRVFECGMRAVLGSDGRSGAAEGLA